MDPELPFAVEKTLLPAPSSTFRTVGVERVGPKLAEIRPTPAAHRLFRFIKTTAYAGPLVFVGVFVFIQLQSRSADPGGVFASKWVWFLPPLVLVADLVGAPLFLRFVRRAMLPEPTRIDLANGILTLPASMTGSLAALLGGTSATPKEVRMSDVAALQILYPIHQGR